MAAILLEDNGLNRVYQISTGEHIDLKLDEEDFMVTVTNSNNEEIGSAEFKEIDDGYGSYYKLTWMYLDKLEGRYKNLGLGRACIEQFNDFFDTVVHASENDGQTQNDGSHLTQDAPGFIDKLRVEGLIL